MESLNKPNNKTSRTFQ